MALLKNHEKKYKSKPTQFVSVAAGTKKRAENIWAHRRSSRLSVFDAARNLPQTSGCESSVPISAAKVKMEHQRQQLEKWKEKKKKKELLALKKKPFIVGVVGVKFVLSPAPKAVPSISGCVTWSQSAQNKKTNMTSSKHIQPQSFAPENAIFHAPEIKTLKKIPKLAPKQTRSRTLYNTATEGRITRKVAAKGKSTKQMQNALNLQSSSSSEIECPPKLQTSSSSDDEGLLDEDSSDVDVDHFRRQLASEIKRMMEMCDTWDKIYEQVTLAEHIQELVLGSVGQARLLMSQKLQQFATLVERCARPEPGAALVTPADLQGFWDMAYMQINNVDMGFIKLEELKARNWVEEAPAPVARRARAAVKPAVKPKATGGPSRLKEIIAAARKAKQQAPAAPAADEKTFEAGFFCVRSPSRSPTPARSPYIPVNKHNLLKAVLSSEAKKASNNSSSFAMLRASMLAKSGEVEGVAPLPQNPVQQCIKLNATPARSILKQAQGSARVVLFHVNIPTDNIIQQEDENTDRQMSSVDVKEDSTQKDKENSSQKKRLLRQDAVDECSPPMTRNRRRTKQTPQAQEKILQEIETNVIAEKTSKRSGCRSSTKKIQEKTEINVIEENTDRQMSSVDVKEDSTQKDKENSSQKKRLLRQDAVDECSPPMTRNRRRTKQTPQAQEKILQEIETNVIAEKTSKRSVRKCSTKKIQEKTEINVIEENIDRQMSSVDVKEDSTQKYKENSSQKKRLLRQDAVDECSPPMTRNRRRTKQTPQAQEKILQEIETNVIAEKTSKRSGYKSSTKKIQEKTEINVIEENTDRQMSSVDVKEDSTQKDKENSSQKKRLLRQDAVDECSPPMTRNRRRTKQTPQAQEKILQEIETNVIAEKTSKRSVRKCSTKKIQEKTEINVIEENIDRQMSSVDVKEDSTQKYKENSSQKKRLLRQDAVDECSPPMTRNRRRTKQTPQAQEKILQEIETNVIAEKTSKRSGYKSSTKKIQEKTEINVIEENTDRQMSSVDVKEDSTQKDKENSSQKKRLLRQDAVDECSPPMTRNRRRTKQTPQAQEKILQEIETNVIAEKTSKRSGRKCSTKKIQEKTEINLIEENTDRQMSSVDVKEDSTQKDKKNSSQKKRLLRQDAVDECSPPMTRNRRRTKQTPQAQEKILQEIETNVIAEKTSKRSGCKSSTKKIQEKTEINVIEENTDRQMSSVDVKEDSTQKDKENSSQKKRLLRQDAVDECSPPMTRKRRRTKQTPQAQEKILQEIETNVIAEKTSKRSGRKCSTKKIQEKSEINVIEEKQIPRRSTRNRKTVDTKM